MDSLIKVTKFHSLMLVRVTQKKIEKNEYLYYSLLKKYLDEGCMDYPNEGLVLDYQADRYDMSISFSSIRFGTEMQYTYALQAVDPKYVNDKDYTIDEIVKSFSILDKPILVKNTFSEKVLKIAKKKLLLELNELLTEPSVLANESFMDYMISDDLYKINYQKLKEDISTINHEMLYEYYLRYINSPSTTIIEGNIDDLEVTNKINLKKYDVLSTRPNYNGPSYVEVPYKSKQAYLSIYYDTNIKRNDIRIIDLNMINYILGGSSYSKLFKCVREEDGLAYSISSQVIYNNEALIVNAMLNKSASKQALEKIDYTFEHLFDDINLEEIKKVFLHDELLGKDAMTYYYSQVINDITIENRVKTEKRIERIKEITIDDLKETLSLFEKKLVHVFGGVDNE